MQARVTLAPGGASDLITAYSEPSGAGVRVDGCGYLGLQVRSEFDPLLAKVITHAPASSFEICLRTDYYRTTIDATELACGRNLNVNHRFD